MFQHIEAQRSISGIVISSIDNKPLAAASVFINNSSKGTIAGADGKFEINNISEIDFELVASYAGYSSRSIRINASNIGNDHTIKLKPRDGILNEVNIRQPEKNGWARFGSLFIESFIGRSKFASDCKIENPEVILFFLDKGTQVLAAHSRDNVIISNNALGYIVKYQLEQFTYDPFNKILNFYGFTSFEDMQTKNKNKSNKWMHNRHEAYMGSIKHFMRSLYSGKVKQDGFDVRENLRVDSNFKEWKTICCNNIPETVTLNGNLYNTFQGPKTLSREGKFILNSDPAWIDLIGDTEIDLSSINMIDAQGHKLFRLLAPLQIIYKKGYEKPEFVLQTTGKYSTNHLQESVIYMATDDPIMISSNGMYFDPLNLVTDGYWGWCRMAFMLPSDYEDN